MNDPIYDAPKAPLDNDPELRNRLISLPHAGSWRRFFARMMDIWSIAIVSSVALGYVGALLSPAFVTWINKPGSDSLFGIAILPLVLLLEGLIYGIFGNTPGKKIMGIRVITVDGYPLTPGQYFSRQAGVYLAGLGLGIPLVNLVTMARQSSRLGKGEQASYDQHKFNVKSEKLGRVRIVSGVALLLLVFGVVVAINVIEQREQAALSKPAPWTNQYSGRTVSIPPGWKHQTTENVDGQPLDVFSNDALGSLAIFAGEDVAGQTMDSYLELLASAVSSEISLESRSEVQVASMDGVQLLGHRMTSDAEPVKLIVVKLGSSYFRLVIVSTTDREPDSADEKELERVLFGSL